MNYAFHSEAEAEFKHAIDYYESCAEGLGYDFAVEVYSTIEQNFAFANSPFKTSGEIAFNGVIRFSV
ncbi:MAG: hypothetical protein LWX02_11755 [Deltaproteobacteria bacterium]|jgi:hypothetical protein|nr:hypothetical protein [Deltaproteobacteria bacterium]MDL1986349.1 hypothetical protein [Deltaproteobacteria bacterium]